MEAIRTIAAAIVAVYISFRVGSLSAFTLKNIQNLGRLYEAVRIPSLRELAQSAVVHALSTTKNQELRI